MSGLAPCDELSSNNQQNSGSWRQRAASVVDPPFRSGTTRQSHDIIAQCPLAIMLQQIPVLVDLLKAAECTALRSCSRQLRNAVNNTIRVVKLQCPYQLDMLVKGDWPRLTLITVNKHLGMGAFWCENANFQLLAKVEMHQIFESKIVLLVRAKSLPSQLCASQDSSCATLLWQYLSRPKWHDLSGLILKDDQFATNSMAQLTAIPWPKLYSLSLTGNGLDAAAVAHLAEGQWPELRSLDLGNNQLHVTDEASITAMEHLLRVHMPKLCSIGLADDHLGNEDMHNLAKGAWPSLYGLRLHGNHFDAEGLENVTHGHWPTLSVLSLDMKYVSADKLQSILTLHPDCPLPTETGGEVTRHVQALEQAAHWLWPELVTVQLCSYSYSEGHSTDHTAESHGLAVECSLSDSSVDSVSDLHANLDVDISSDSSCASVTATDKDTKHVQANSEGKGGVKAIVKRAMSVVSDFLFISDQNDLVPLVGWCAFSFALGFAMRRFHNQGC